MRQSKEVLWYRRFGWILAAVMLLGGCTHPAKDGGMSAAELHEFWAGMTAYQATMQVTFISNRGSNTYTVRQQALSSGPYRMEVLAPEESKGVVTVYDGKQTVQEDPSIGMRVKAADTPVRNTLFLYPFWQQYLQSDSAYIQGGALRVSALPEYSDTEAPPEESPSDTEYMLEIQLNGNHEKLSVERLWLSTQNGYPLRMEVYDAQGSASIRIEYLDFVPNAELDPKLFTIEEK